MTRWLRSWAGVAAALAAASAAATPTVSGVSISSTPADGASYRAAEVIEIDVTFSEGVLITAAIPRLALGIGTNTRSATYSSAESTTTALAFTYTVQAADFDGDGISIAANALTCVDRVGNPCAGGIGIGAASDFGATAAALGLGTHAIANASAHTVNDSAPTFGTASVESQHYFVGTAANLELPAATGGDGAVSHTLAPSLPRGLALDAGTRRISGTPQQAASRGTFTWTATDADGDAAQLSFGITIAAANAPRPIRLTLATHGDGNYATGETIMAFVSFDRAVAVTGTPQLALTIGGQVRQASASGSTAADVVFRYAVVAADFDGDGIGVAADALTLNGGAIADASTGVAAALGLGGHAIAHAAGHAVNDSAPVFAATIIADQTLEKDAPATVALPTATGDGTITYATVPPLPAGLAIDAATATIAGTPTAAGKTTHVLKATDADGDAATLGTFAIHVVPAPAVSSVRIVSSPAADGTYGRSEIVKVAVGFDRAVAVAGANSSITLPLDIGGRTLAAAYNGQSSDGRLRFAYTLTAGETDANGISVDSPIALGGSATIRDATTQFDAGVDLGTHAIANATAHKVNGALLRGLAPTAVRFLSTPASSDGYDVGERIEVEVAWPRTVVVTGTPQLALGIGANTRQAAYERGSVTGDSLLFAYTVAADDGDADGISIAAAALALNSGTIRDGAGTAATLALGSHAIDNASAHKVFTPPTVTGFAVTSSPPHAAEPAPAEQRATYTLGQTITVRASLDQTVTVVGSPALALAVGGATRQATATAGSGTAYVDFSYTVAAADLDTDGIGIHAGALSLPGGTIRDADGNGVQLDLTGRTVARFANAKVNGAKNGTWPAFGSVAAPLTFSAGVAASATLPSAHVVGQTVAYAVAPALPDGLAVTGGSIASRMGSMPSTVISGTTASASPRTRYVLTARDGANGWAGGPVQHDTATLPFTLEVTGSNPTVNGVSFLSTPIAASTYGQGEEIRVAVSFRVAAPGDGSSNVVRVIAAPTLALAVGGQVRQATYDGVYQDGVRFRYVVQAADSDADGIGIAADALALNGGSIRDAAGNDAVLALGVHASAANSAHKVDGGSGSAPTVAAVTITSTPAANGTYKRGEEIEVAVRFDRTVAVTGSPQLTLGIASGNRTAAWERAGTSPTTHYFRYATQQSDVDVDGLSIGAGALALNGGAIRGGRGGAVDANLNLAVHAISNASGHKLDGSQSETPFVTGVSFLTLPARGSVYRVGETIRLRATFNRAVRVTTQLSVPNDPGFPQLALGFGSETRYADFEQSSVGLQPATRTLTFAYAVQAGDYDADGLAVTALAANRSIIRLGSVDANLSLGSHAIAAASYTVDARQPQVSGVRIVSAPAASQNSQYAAGDGIEAEVTFDLPIATTGSPQLALAVGSNERQMALRSAGGSALRFGYTVQSSDSDADGVSIGASALTLNSGSVTGRDTIVAARLGLGTHALGNQPAHKVNGLLRRPTVASWRVLPPLSGNRFSRGETILVEVTFSEPVVMVGRSDEVALDLAVGDAADLSLNGRRAPAARVSGAVAVFEYAVQQRDVDSDGLTVLANALQFYGAGALRSLGGVDVDPDLRTDLIDSANHLVDGSSTAAPGILRVQWQSQPANGSAYVFGETMTFAVVWNAPIQLSGTVQAYLQVGGAKHAATPKQAGWRTLAGVAGADGRSVEFSYVVQAGDTTEPNGGVWVQWTGLELGTGATLRGTAGSHNAALTFGSAPVAVPDHGVDGYCRPNPAFVGNANVSAQRWRAGSSVGVTLPAPSRYCGFKPSVAALPDSVQLAVTPALPDGVSFNRATRAITGVPTTVLPPTTYTYRMTDTVVNGSASLAFTIEITPNNLPTFGTATVGSLDYVQHSPIAPVTLPAASGGDGTLRYTLSGPTSANLRLPAGIAFAQPSGTATGGTLSGTPSVAAAAATYTLTVQDVDNDQAALAFAMQVEADAAPRFTSAVDNQAWTRHGAISAFALPLASGGNGTVTYSLSPALPSGVTKDANHRVSGTPSVALSNTVYTWTATDGDGDAAELIFSIEIEDAPTFGSATVDDQAWTRHSAITALTLPTATDGDGTLSYTLSPALPNGVTEDASHRVSGTPSVALANTAYTWTATDANGDKATVSFHIAVEDAPTFGTATVGDQRWKRHQAIADFTLPTATDGDGTLAYTLSPALPTGVAKDDDHEVSGTPSGVLATSTFTWTATDTNGDKASLTFDITVENAPTFGDATVPNQSWIRHKPITAFTLPTATDGDGTLSYAISPAWPSGVAKDGDHEVSGKPSVALAATDYTWTATDGDGDKASVTFSVAVADNNVPSFGTATVDDQTWTRNAAIAGFTLPTATGGDGAISYEIDPALPAGVAKNASHEVSGTPAAAQAAATYTWTATDADDDEAELTFQIAVQEETPTVTLAVADGAIAENGGTTTVTATLARASTLDTTVTVTAVAGAYNVGADAEITIAAGETTNASDSVTITAVDNAKDEPDRATTVTGTAANSRGAGSVTGAALTLTDNDAAPTVSLALASSSIAENGGSTTVTATLSHASSAATTITVTAVSGVYAVGADATIAIPAGSTSNSADTATINAVDDDVDNVTARTGIVTAGAQNTQGVGSVTGASLTLTDDEATPTVSLALSEPDSAKPDTINESGTGNSSTVTATLSGKSSEAVTLTVAATAGTNAQAADFSLSATKTLTIAAGATASAGTVTITAAHDTEDEPAQQVSVTATVSGSSGVAAPAAATLTIADDDAAPTVALALASSAIAENGGSTTVTATLSHASSAATTITVTAVSGLYAVGADATITIPAGSTSNSADTATITAVDDDVDNVTARSGTVTAAAQNGQGVGAVTGAALTLTDDEATPTVSLALSEPDAAKPDTISESAPGNVSAVTATLSGKSSEAVTLRVAATAGTNAQAADFALSAAKTLTIAAGATASAGTVTITAVHDTEDEPNQQVSVTATVSGTSGVSAPAAATLTIADDDAAPTVALALASSTIAESGGSTTVTATLNRPSSAATTVTVIAVSGLYAVGADVTITIPAGSTSNSDDTATINAVDDDVDNVTARGGTVTATAQNGQGIGAVTGASLTLTDDEATPTVALALSEPDAATPDTINESAPGNASTVTATLSGKSSEAVTLTVAATAGTNAQAADFALSAAKTLTIAAGATDSTGTVTITAAHDQEDEPNQQVSVTATVSGSSGVAAPAGATLTIADDDGAPTVALTLASSTIAENGGSTTVAATLSHASSAATTITVTAVSGLYAVSGADATITIPAGSTSASADTATIAAVDDDVDNVTARSGTVTATAQNAQGVGAVSGAALTLTDDEATPTVTLALSEPDAAKPDTINESAPGNASTVTATLSGKSSEAVTLTVAATAGTDAQAGDFALSAAKTLTIAAGATASSGTVTVTAVHDTEDEPAQQVSVTATVSGSSGLAAPAAATLTIADDDAAPTVALALASSSIAENGGSTTVTATLSRASSAATTITVTAASGLYAVGADATITIPAGSTSASADTATITAVDDDVDNVTARGGTVTATAQNGQGIGTVSGASLTLTDDEATPTVSLALSEPDASKPDQINESGVGNSSAVTATLSGKSSEAVTLTVAATAGTNAQAADFALSTAKTLTIAAGATGSTGTVTITAAHDQEDEPNQQVTVTATVSGSSGVAAPAAVTLTIADDDGAPTVALGLASSSIAENGGSTTVTATLNRASSAATTVTVTAVSGFYTVGADATITIPAGSTSNSTDTATIAAVDDDVDNVTARTGIVTAGAQNAQGLGPVSGASLTLTDDEPTPTVALALSEPDAAKPDTIKESGTGNSSTVTATLSGKSSEAVTLTVAATAGTNAQAADFALSAAKTLTIAAGATASSGTVTVTAAHDTEDEPAQQVSVTATVSGSSGVAAPAAATLTIADDDAAPTVALALASSSIAENGGSTAVTATLSHASSAATTVTVTAVSGLYSVGADATITIPAGSTSNSSDTATINAVDDDVDNVTARGGTVTATAQNGQGVGTVSGASLTLTDDEATPTVSLALSEPDAAKPDTINESAPGNASTVTATLSGKSSEAVTLTVAATAGTNAQAADFTLSATKTLTIVAGATASSGTVTVTAAHDTEDEPAQQVSVTATVSGSSGVAAPAPATLTIADDDAAPTVALALASSTIAENGGSTTVTATLNRASSAATTVTVTAASGLYTVGSDATITIPAGSTSASADTATINAVDDDVDNVTARGGTVTATAQNAQGIGTVSGASLTLADDEATPTVSLALSEPDAAKPDTINESAPGNASTVTATLSGKSSEAVTLTVAATAGTNAQAADFTLSAAKTLTIAAGATGSTGTVTITAAHDQEDEPEQQVSVTATVSGSSGVAAPVAATLTIADDDGAPTVALTLASSSIAENGGSTTVTATLNRASSAATTITVTAVSGLYSVGADATITIPAGSTSNSTDTATIAAVDDDVDNVTARGGTVTATAQNGQGIGAVTGASLTLADDEATPTLSLALSEPDAAKPDTINESAPGNSSSVTATLSGKSSEAVTLTIAATAGTNAQAADFSLSATKTLTIAAGATASSGAVTVTAVHDTEDEPAQQVSVTATISGSSGVAAPAAATLTIADDDAAPNVTLALASSSIAENGGSTTVTATLNRASSATTTITVTAVSGLYSVGADATITIPAGSTSNSADTATIAAVDDDVDNVIARSGTVTATAQNGQGIGAVSGASLTLADDEATPTVSLALSEPDAAKPDTIGESAPGNASTVTATLSGKSSEAVTLTVAATAGTNAQAADFALSATKTLTIAAGATNSTGTVTITAAHDTEDEPNQQVSVTAVVSGGSGVAAPAAATLTIADDDGAPNVALALASSTIAENGGSTTVTATLNRASSAATTITVTAASGFYSVGADATITIPAGSTSNSTDTATIAAVDDDVDNVAARTVIVTAGAQNSQGIGAVSGALLTLTDDEPTPTVSLALSEPDAAKPDTINESAPGNSSTVTATLSGKSSEAVTLTVAATAGTNAQAADFTLSATKTLTIAAGATASSGTVTITAAHDQEDEPDQQVSVTATVSGSSGVAAPAAATLTIADDDGAPNVALALASSSIAENGGSTTVRATLNRASSAATTITVTAVSGLYSVGADATITIPAGSTSNSADTATITAVDDDVDNVTARGGTVTATAQNGQGIGAVTGASLTLADDEATPTLSLALSEPDAAKPDTINESAPGNSSSVTATLSGKSSEAVTLTVAATAGANAQAADFSLSTAKTLTIAAGATGSSGTVTITAAHDQEDEPDQQVSVTATVSGSSGVGAPAAATLTIADDDGAPNVALALASSTIAENGGGTTVTATLNRASSAATTITVTAVSGLYSVGADATITIPAGSTSNAGDTATIAAVDDDLDNVTARTGIVTAGAQNAQGIGPVSGASLTLTDDEPTPTVALALSEPDAAKPDTINESAPGNASTVTATLSGKSSEAVTLTVAATAGTNAQAADFTLSATKTLTIAAGATASAGTVTITAAHDVEDEPDQQVSVTVTVSGSSGVAAPAAATLTIADDDGAPTVALALASSTIAESGGSTTVTATLNRASSADTTITVTAVSGLYAVGSDATITIPAGATSNSADTAAIAAVDDDVDNVTARGGTVTATAQNAQGIGAVAGASLTLTDDEPTPTVSLALSEPDAAKPNTINESGTGNSSTLTATLSGKSSEAVTLTVAATASTNAQAADFTLSAAKTLIIAAGATASTGTVTITAAHDVLDEPDQQVSVTATVSGSSGVAAPAAATLTIADDDPMPTLAIDSPSVAEGAAGTTASLTFAVTLSAASGRPVSVGYADAGTGTATSGTDYQAVAAGALAFAAGETRKTIAVTVTGDDAAEGDETVVLALSSPVNATVGTAAGTGTIKDQAPSAPADPEATIVADAGADQTVYEGEQVLLDGSGSVGALVYAWRQTAGEPTVALEDADAATATFVAPMVEATVTLAFELAVSAAGETQRATTSVVVRKRPQDLRAAADVVVVEGDEGEREVVFRLPLRTTTAGTAVYDYRTRDGTAKAGEDYKAAAGRVSLAPGETHGVVGVKVRGDRVPEPDETYRVAFVAVAPAAAPRVEALGVIVNDDGGTFGLDDAWHRETDEGHPKMGFVAYLPEPATTPVRAWYRTRDGTAEAGKDYYATQGEVVIQPGQLAQTVWVSVIGDLEREPDETFEVVLTGYGVEGEEGASVVATGTILDNDFPSLSMASIASDEGNEGVLPMAFVAKLSAPSPRPIRVAYATRDVTAKAGDDYEAASGELTFAPGETEQRVVVHIACDLIVEDDDRFELVLSDAENVKLRTVAATATIRNDDQAFLAIAPVGRVVEGGGAKGRGQPASAQAKFEVSLSAVSHRTVAAGFLTRNGTAQAGRDYLARSGELFFPPGAQSREVFVTVLDDAVAEADETFALELVEPENAELAPDRATAVATIVDDDSQAQAAATALAEPALSVADAKAMEAAGEIVFDITLTPAAAVPVAVAYETEDGSARAGRDYLRRQGELAFAPGQRHHTLRVPVQQDATPEADETFRLLLRAPVNAGVTRARATGTIVDDDAAQLSVALVPTERGAGLKEGEASSAAFRITLAPASEQPVRVAYRTQDGTARAGEDYAATAGVAEFPPGTVEQLVSVPLLDDDKVEPAETFRLLLAAPANAELAVAAALATIGDDDGERRDAAALGLALGRFGQAFGASVVDAVSDSLLAGADAAPVLGGQTLALETAPLDELGRRGVRLQPRGGREAGDANAVWAAHPSDWALAEPRLGSGPGGASGGIAAWPSLGGQENALLDFLARTSFNLRLGQREKGASEGRRPGWRLWGSGTVTSPADFAESDGWQLGGSVYATHLGVAATAGRAVFGTTVSHGRGAMKVAQDGASGVVDVAVTAALPFLRWQAAPGLDLWGVAGAGRGRAGFAGLGGAGCAPCDGRGLPLRMQLLALGMRQELKRLGGFELAFKGDALAVQTITELPGVEPLSRRLRLLLDAKRNWLATDQLALSTNVALGGRWDGGDAAAGGGAELGGGMDLRHRALGLAVRGSGRVLLGGSGAREWGGNLALELDPGVAGLGPSVRLQPAWGVAGGGTDSLWRQGHVAREQRPGESVAGLGGGRWDLAFGYGLPQRRDTQRRLSFGVSQDESMRSAYRLGGEIGRADTLQLRLELNRQGEPPAYGFRLESVGRF